MTEFLKEGFATAGYALEALGVLAILAGFAFTAFACALRLNREGALVAYKEFRRGVGRSIIFGLEFLIAVTLGLDIEERWPWRCRTD